MVASEEGAALLDELVDTMRRYVILPSDEAADSVALFVAATHAQEVWEHATRLVIKSPVKRCGKSRLQEVCRHVVHRALPTTNISPAALVRSIGDEDPPTIILDEADTIWRSGGAAQSESAEAIRGILNSGHSRGWPYIRWDANARRLEMCPTFAMAIVGGIGDMPDTIEDRAVIVTMRRRLDHERVDGFRARRDVPVLERLRGRLADWVSSSLDELAVAEPELPVDDRAADTWESLVAVADAAGGSWPDRARHACDVAVNGADDEPDTAGELLLADMRHVWGAATFLYSTTVLDRLVRLDGAPWSEWRRGGREPINSRGLAQLLRPFGVLARNGREKGTGPVRKGYYQADLTEPWDRYVADVEDVADGVADGSATGHTTVDLGLFADVADVTHVAAGGGQRGRAGPLCQACGEWMLVTQEGQRYHPCCEDEIPTQKGT